MPSAHDKKALEHCQWLERNVQVKNQTGLVFGLFK